MDQLKKAHQLLRKVQLPEQLHHLRLHHHLGHQLDLKFMCQWGHRSTYLWGLVDQWDPHLHPWETYTLLTPSCHAAAIMCQLAAGTQEPMSGLLSEMFEAHLEAVHHHCREA